MSERKASKEDWKTLREKIPAIERNTGPIDESLMKVYIAMAEQEDEAINPAHYTSASIECIDAIQESMCSIAYKGYLKGNCMKYLWRYESKHPDKPLQDLQKAGWYLDRLMETVSDE